MEVPDELRRFHSTLDVPTNIIVGAADTLTLPEDSRELAQRLPRGELTVVLKAGHALIVEAPRSFNRNVLSFLARHGRQAAS